ncbi:hypothetical protein GKIL_4423 [Gloeobacter kilaueensis JS1]|uniref:Uncharacterized protein n=1 Tax=Gloeobacter kilaueensis (strain ATCC BAA-2537 / CCAP 1431/1 / ULC 316 / JS1) TaxID=1183438 RepID=U5QSL6_GLOK1|nr:hypothetical protein GKIL_4423 [Gloeobacter kilaueensis JS1]
MLVTALLVACSGQTSKRTPARDPESRAVYSTDERLLIKLVRSERLSASEGVITVRVSNSEQQVAGSAVVDPSHFFIAPEGSNQTPQAAVDLSKSTLKRQTLAIHQSTGGKVFFKIKDQGVQDIVYGDDPVLAVRVGRIPAFGAVSP